MITKDQLVEKNWSVWKKNLGGRLIFFKGRGRVLHQNLSGALLSQAQELPLILFLPPLSH